MSFDMWAVTRLKDGSMKERFFSEDRAARRADQLNGMTREPWVTVRPVIWNTEEV